MSNLEEKDQSASTDHESMEGVITLQHEDLELIIRSDSSSPIVITNYDILAYVQDDSFELSQLFESADLNSNTSTTVPSTVIETRMVELHENENDEEMMILIEELNKKYAGDTSKLECFPTNPLLSDNSTYRIFLEDEQRIGVLNWCNCSNCTMMPTNIESICCRESNNIEPYMGDVTCIVQHQYFDIFCHTLQIVLQTIGQVQTPPPQKDLNRGDDCTFHFHIML